MRLVSSKVCPIEPCVAEGGDKIIWFVRHGQSTANVVGRPAMFDANYRDATLTATGEQQASDLQHIVSTWDIDHIITSPLTRALQTTCIAFAGRKDVPDIKAMPICTERGAHCQESMGRSVLQLQADPKLSRLPHFATIDWKDPTLHGEWWSVGDDDGRYVRFMQDVKELPYNRIVVVCHWGFIRTLMSTFGQEDVSLHNCQWLRTEWDSIDG